MLALILLIAAIIYFLLVVHLLVLVLLKLLFVPSTNENLINRNGSPAAAPAPPATPASKCTVYQLTKPKGGFRTNTPARAHAREAGQAPTH